MNVSKRWARVTGVASAAALAVAGFVALQTTSASAVTACTVAAAGDIAEAGGRQQDVGNQIRSYDPTYVLPLGDIAYESGTTSEFNTYYHPAWGSFKSITRPTPGNHEYKTANAAGYFSYFADQVGTNPYYAFDLCGWRLYSLNSELTSTSRTNMIAWFNADATAHASQPKLAYWHKPRFSDGTGHGNDTTQSDLWSAAVANGVRLVLNGHEHIYERYAEMNASGAVTTGGTRQFIVGTGGAGLSALKTSGFNAGSQRRVQYSHGAMKLTLGTGRYDWSWADWDGSVTDTGFTTFSTPTPTTSTSTSVTPTTTSTSPSPTTTTTSPTDPTVTVTPTVTAPAVTITPTVTAPAVTVTPTVTAPAVTVTPTVTVSPSESPSETSPSPTTSSPSTPPGGGLAWLSGASSRYANNGEYGNWRGEPVTMVGSWSDTQGCAETVCSLDYGEMAALDGSESLDIAIGAIWSNESWTQAAAGAYNARWQKQLENLKTKTAAKGLKPGQVYIRFAHEMNGSWVDWRVPVGQEANFRNAISRFSALRYQVFGMTNTPKVVLCANDGTSSGMASPTNLFVGVDGSARKVVDVYCVDTYNSWPHRTDAAQIRARLNDASATQNGAPVTLEGHRKFAESKGVPFSIGEWSNCGQPSKCDGGGGESPAFVTEMNRYMREHAGDPNNPKPGQFLYDVQFNLWTQYAFYGPEANQPQTSQAYRDAVWGR